MARQLELPVEERESVDAGMRQIAFLDTEIAAVERLIAQQALAWPEIRRLMTVPGVNLICAASFLAAIGELSGSSPAASWSPTWAGPKVRQSGEAPARSGRISKRGSASARWALVEAAWSVVMHPAHSTRSTSAPAAGEVTAKRSSRPPASSRSCSGACSTAQRTTPTNDHP